VENGALVLPISLLPLKNRSSLSGGICHAVRALSTSITNRDRFTLSAMCGDDEHQTD
jgi:hypothetical protein